MSTSPTTVASTIIPCLRYRNAPAAVVWLCDVFGFVQHAVYTNDDGTIAHAELTLGNGMVMLGSVLEIETEWGELIKQPDELGGAETQSPCLVVADADIVYARAKASGAKIVLEIEDKDYGGRGFSCYDLEGHLWTIGTYNPWAQAM